MFSMKRKLHTRLRDVGLSLREDNAVIVGGFLRGNRQGLRQET
jgi:hypothetical protein